MLFRINTKTIRNQKHSSSQNGIMNGSLLGELKEILERFIYKKEQYILKRRLKSKTKKRKVTRKRSSKYLFL
jgi:hypothetical protein